MKKSILLYLLFIFNCSFLIAIEVGGHITEDTTWSPENNPYNVIEVLYVDEDVTLKILPGTEIFIDAAPLTSYDELQSNFSYNAGNPGAKFFWVDGRIIAEGTEENRIIFTRLQDEPEHFWGTIYITELAEMCRFQYCDFEYAQEIMIAVGHFASGTIAVYNKTGLFKNNIFLNNHCGIMFHGIIVNDEIEITDNQFYYTEDTSQFGYSFYGRCAIDLFYSASNDILPIISNNQINNLNSFSSNSVTAFNTIKNYDVGFFASSTLTENVRSSYIYKNNFENCNTGLNIRGNSNSSVPFDSLYIKNNRFIGGLTGIEADYAYVEISDNYLDGCGINASMGSSGKINNNVVNQAGIEAIGELELLNNISINGFKGFAINQINSINNSIALNNDYALGGYYNDFYNNCIILNNDNLSQYGVSGNPIFRNCILDFELPPECIDGGGNIWVDSLQAQQIFADIENGDFHLAEGSIAIDAGFDTTGYYYPFDIDYHKRVWDGNNDGNAVIDIGPYEYGAPEFGKIKGHITETTTGEPVKYVLIKPNDNPGDFVVSDSTGYFEIQLPEGNYNLYCQRVFYEDNIIYGVTLEDDQDTVVDFNMTSTLPPVSTNNDELVINKLQVKNYPNPFNPITTISFNLPSNSNVTISIYNIKGQKVKSLINKPYSRGKHSIVWNGKNDNNKSVASGVYLCKIRVANQESIKRMLLLK